jgi:hypothetical protein
MDYQAGQIIVSSEDVARLLSVAYRSLRRWITTARSSLPLPPGCYGFYSRLYAGMAVHELHRARTLLEQDQVRAAGAIAGVALELHLRHVAAAHCVNVGKHPSIAHLQDLLRTAGLLQQRQQKVIQRLATTRNRCVHARKHEPSGASVARLIAGVARLMHEMQSG